MADEQTINLAEKKSLMKINGRVTAVSKDEIMHEDTDVSRRTVGIPDLPGGTETELLTSNRMLDTERDESFISVSDMGSVFCASKKQVLRELNEWKPSGSYGYIVERQQTCKPFGGNYFENIHFNTETELLNVPDQKRVTLCTDKETKETFVRKQVPSEKWNKNEAVVPLTMDHDNIAKILGLLQSDEGVFIRLELLLENAGPSLDQFLQKKYPLRQSDFLEICSQGLVGLSYLHLHKIIHHDVKPQNICVAENCNKLRVKLIDFGSARRPYQKVTVKDWTPEYMAPECCKYYRSNKGQDAAAITTKVDVFSFGMVCGYIKTHRHMLMRLVTDGLVYEKETREILRRTVIKKMAENGEEIITSLIDDIQCEADTKNLIKQMSSFCFNTRLSSEEALKLVKELAEQNEKKENQPHRTAVMTEETEVESCSGAKTAHFSVFIKQNESKLPRLTEMVSEESETESCTDAKMASLLDLVKHNESKHLSRAAVMTEELKVDRCSDAKTANISVRRTQAQSQENPAAADRGLECGKLQNQQPFVLKGYPTGSSDQTQRKLLYHPPKLLEKRPMPAVSKTCHQVKESQNGTAGRALNQSPQELADIQSVYEHDEMKPPDDWSDCTEHGFCGGVADSEIVYRSIKGNLPNFELILD